MVMSSKDLNLVFHVHTSHSYDSLVRPRNVVKHALANGISSIAVTDHDTIAGSIDVANCAKGTEVQAIIGAEYATNFGDVVGIFLTHEISTRDAHQVIDEIHKQGGLAILPHPFYQGEPEMSVARRVDMIEVFNSRLDTSRNSAAVVLAETLNKPKIVGPDAHFLSDYLAAVMRISTNDKTISPDNLLTACAHWKTRYTHERNKAVSQLIKAYKQRRPRLFAFQLASLMIGNRRTHALKRKFLIQPDHQGQS
jgi:predicted metal-dependent phosphoesterase TrpH